MTSRMPERARTDQWEPWGSNPGGATAPNLGLYTSARCDEGLLPVHRRLTMLLGDPVDAFDNRSTVVKRMSRIAVMGAVRQERPNPGASLVSAFVAVPREPPVGWARIQGSSRPNGLSNRAE